MRIAIAGACLALVAAPAAAQWPPFGDGSSQVPPSSSAPRAESPDWDPAKSRYRLRMKEHAEKRMFEALSDNGRRTMLDAMRSTDRAELRSRIAEARARMLRALEAERLDTTALRRAMQEEQTIADAARDLRQAALLEAYRALSLADRRALVAESRQLKDRMDKRLKHFRERRLGDVPPPPAPPPPPGAMFAPLPPEAPLTE